MQNSQEVAKTIKKLAKDKNIKMGDMLSACGLSVNALSSMQSGGYYPRLEGISKIADYLNCSIDYLLGRTDKPDIITQSIKITATYNGDGEKNVLWNKYAILDSEDRTTVDGLIDTLLSKEKYIKKPDQNVG